MPAVQARQAWNKDVKFIREQIKISLSGAAAWHCSRHNTARPSIFFGTFRCLQSTRAQAINVADIGVDLPPCWKLSNVVFLHEQDIRAVDCQLINQFCVCERRVLGCTLRYRAAILLQIGPVLDCLGSKQSRVTLSSSSEACIPGWCRYVAVKALRYH